MYNSVVSMPERLKPVTGPILTPEFAQRINAGLQELSPDTQITDLKDWRDKPYLLPSWTLLRLRLSHLEDRQVGTMLSAILKSNHQKPDHQNELTLTDLSSNFNIYQVPRFGKLRRSFLLEVFRNTLPTVETPAVDLDELTRELTKRGIVRPPRQPRELRERHIKIKPERHVTTKVVRVEHRPIATEDKELWEYAVDHNLFEEMIESKRISTQEFVQLTEYFKGSTTNGSIPFELMERFSQAVAFLG